LSINIDEITNLQQWKTWALQELEKNHEGSHSVQAELEELWMFFIGNTTMERLSLKALEAFRNAIQLRSHDHYPLAYLTGECTFAGNRFFISEQPSENYRQGINLINKSFDSYKTYVPRVETEWIVKRTAQELKNRSKTASHPLRVLDIATGSGCLAISIKKYCPEVDVTAVDISKQALKVAQRNQKENGVSIRLLQGSWFDPVLPETFDLVICNPPYVPIDQIQQLSRGANHEPKQAHHPQESPEALFEHLYKQVREVLKADGCYIFEIGFGQFGSENFNIAEAANSVGLTAQIHKDKDGTERFVTGSLI